MYQLIPDIPTDEHGGVTNIGSDSYIFKMLLFDSENQNLIIKKPAITDLVLVDDIKNWYHYGYVDIRNSNDILERSITEELGNFSFRNDGELYLYFSIEPNLSADPIPTHLNSRTFSMEFVFAVYGIEDIENDIENKIKRLYFTDVRNHILNTHHSYFSTNNTYKKLLAADGFESRTAHIANPSVFTGNAVKDLLTTTLGQYFDVKFANDFDIGSTYIQYTSPSSYSGSDDLMYILKSHVSTEESKNAPCIFKADRFVNGEFSLLPITTIFSLAQQDGEAGFLANELFLIGQADTAGDSNQSKYQRVPTGSSFGRNMLMQDKSIINNYYFDDVQGKHNDINLISKVSHMFDFKESKFNIFCTDGFIVNSKAAYKENIVSKLIVEKESKGQVAWLTNGKKKENKLLKHEFIGRSDYKLAQFKSRNKMFMDSILSGRRIVFEVPGMTNRQTMQFIGIDRQCGVTDNKLDDKLLGQYFVTKVTHTFNDDGYTNQITATKQYNYKAIHNE
jgi:hypothetical protein